MKDAAQWKKELREKILDGLDYSKDMSDAEVKELVEEMIVGEAELKLYPPDFRSRLSREVFNSLRRLDILQMFVEDPGITEIMINGTAPIFVEQNGYLKELDRRFESEEKLLDVIQQIVADCNRSVNEASPIVDARLKNGSRVNIVMKPVALNGPILTIRRFPEKPITIEELLRWGTLTAQAAEFLKVLVKSRYNIFISGGTGSGKTTFLNVLSGFIPPGERVITIEDNAELQIQGIRNLVRLETRQNQAEGCREISIRSLIRASLRMRPDRIIVGEVRGAETVDMIQAMNTGHEGSMSTGHANSAADMLARLENMILMGMEIPLPAVRRQLTGGINIIVHLGKLRDQSRKVLEIVEVDGMDGEEIRLNCLYEFMEEGQDEDGKVRGSLVKKGMLKNEKKLKMAGMVLAEERENS